MRIDGPGHGGLVARGFAPFPHAGEKLAPVLNLTAVPGQMLEKTKLDGGEADGLPVACDGPLNRVDQERSDLDHRNSLPIVGVASQHGLHAKTQLTRPDRFGDEIVCPELEGNDTIDLARALREHHRECLTVAVRRRELPQQLRGRHVGRILVEKDGTRAPTRGALQRRPSGRAVYDGDLVVDQEPLELRGQRRRSRDDANLQHHEWRIVFNRVTPSCRRRVRHVRMTPPSHLVSGSFQSSLVVDTRSGESSVVQFAASAPELGAAPDKRRVSWPVAVTRALTTAREALGCAREIRLDSGAPTAVARAERLVSTCGRLGEKLRMKVHIRGEVPRGPSIVVANHLSYLDPLVIGWTLPVGAVAKSEIMDWPGVGEAVADLGVVFVKRGCPQSGAVALRKTMRLVEAGVPVLVFPEGTTTTGHDVLPFARGAFGVARLTRVPVIPAMIRYDCDEAAWVGAASLLPHALKLHRHDEIHAELTFGPRLQPLAFEDASTLAEATRQCIRSLLLP